jgi:hypothetical protein
MTDPTRFLDDIRIASPCRASWDAMTGTDTVRFCGQCRLNVYDLSAMTAAEAAALVARTEGRLCVRLYRRADGTTITRDCPVGLRAAVRRASRAAGALLATLAGMFCVPAARAQDGTGELMGGVTPQRQEHVKMGKIALPRGRDVSISVTDSSGAPVGGAVVSLTDLGTGEAVEADVDGEDGRYVFRRVEPGVYTLTVAADGFELSLPKTLRVKRGQPIRLQVRLHPAR